jgi:hypothetical protein
MSCEERRSAGGGSLSPSKRCRPFNPPARGRGLGHLPVASLRLPCRAGDGALANLLTVQQLGDTLQERAELRRMQRLGRHENQDRSRQKRACSASDGGTEVK